MTHKIKHLILIVLLLSPLAFSSCLVTKKKYETMQAQKNKSIDSLSSILGDTRSGFDRWRSSATYNNAVKTTSIDSLQAVVKKLSADTLELNQELKATIADYNSEKDRLVALEHELQTKKEALEKANTELRELQEMIAANRSEINKLREAIANALNAFTEEELTVHQKDGKVYVSLDEKLLFKSGSAKVDRKGVEALKKLAAVLEKNPDIGILIEGHTDDVGSADYNWDLSVKRATAIVKILQENSSIDPARFTAAGRGMYHPVERADTDEARQKNRRTEIILTPKLDQLYKILNQDTNK